MEQSAKKTLAWGGVGLGLAATLYALDKAGIIHLPTLGGGGTPSNYVLSPSASFQPGITSPYPLGVSVATITWQNPTAQTVTYGVQGYIVANGVVNGHWWTSLAVAEQAMQASRTGGAAALAQYAANVPYRVATVQVATGQQGSVKLYEQLALPETEQWIFLIRPNYASGLVAQDPQGAQAGNIAQSGDAGLTATVQVG